MQLNGDEDGPPGTREGYVTVDLSIAELRRQVGKISAAVSNTEVDMSRLQQACKVCGKTFEDGWFAIFDVGRWL